MGSPATAIAREEFLIAPEFRGLHCLRDPASRVGGARIELVPSGAETALGACYQQIPVRVLPPFNFSGEPAALLYLINLTAGLMDGDAHLLKIVARSGSRALVTGQSATRVHPATASFATQQWIVDVEDDACLVVLPGPTIPFQGCRYFQHARVRLAPRARLIWGDLWLPGRYQRGALSERFQFDRIVQDFEVRREERLVFRDRFCWTGPWSPSQVAWHFGPTLATASLFVTGPLLEPLPEPDAGTRRAVFPLDTGDHCVRWCGDPAAVTTDLVRVALSAAGQWTAAHPPAAWFLDSAALAPNHWFSPTPPRPI